MTIAPVRPQDTVSLRCSLTQPWEAEAELLVVVLVAPAAEAPAWLAEYSEHVRALEADEHLTIHRSAGSGFRAAAVQLVALQGQPSDAVRRAGRRIGAQERSSTSFAVAGLDAGGPDSPAQVFARGFAEGRYRFDRFRSSAIVQPAELVVVGTASGNIEMLSRDLEALQIVEASVNWCRDLVNTPARDLTPVALADEIVLEAQRAGATVRVFDDAWLRAEQFAGLVAVGDGSPHPPRLVEVSYRGAAAVDTPPIVLVGKGVTFDSGGLSLKKASAMMEMKSDMAGAATVAAVVGSIARLAPERAHVVALLALAENMPGPDALRPGDIIRHRNGRTTEVVNTDCEGRLVMSDVLSWAAERSPAAIIDVATLTYSTVAALGIEITAVLGNNAALISAIRQAGDLMGDPYWELPLWRPYRRHIDSPFADLRNEETGDGAGAITAALFLSEFIDGIPWAHLDTGGTAYLDEETDDLEAGATGACVRSLIRLVLDQQTTNKGVS